MSTIFIANASPNDVRQSSDGTYTVPILDKTLTWITESDVNIDHVVLFMGEEEPQENLPHIDGAFTDFIATYVDEASSDVGPDQIQMIAVSDEATHNDAMLRFYAEKLQTLTDYETIYMEVTGGTAAMSFVLLWQGITLFGKRVIPLHVSADHDEPQPLNIGAAMLLDHMDDDFRDLIKIHQYHAALTVLERNEKLFRTYWRYYDAIKAVTKHARQRINFNFEEAETSLRQLKDSIPPAFQERTQAFIVDLDERDDAWILREEIYATELALKNGAYKDALTSIITYREGLMRYYVIALKVPLIDQNRVIDPKWLRKQPGLRDHLRRERVDAARWLNNKSLDKILEFKARFDLKVREACARINKFDDLADLRNQAIHFHRGVSPQMIEETFPGGIKAIVPEMRTLYKAVTGKPIRAQYYQEINAFIFDLIDETTS